MKIELILLRHNINLDQNVPKFENARIGMKTTILQLELLLHFIRIDNYIKKQPHSSNKI